MRRKKMPVRAKYRSPSHAGQCWQVDRIVALSNTIDMLHWAWQAWRLLGWGERGGHLWGNVVEQERFSSAGRRLAVVIWVHYVSKVLTCSVP